jgi:hypothetical protein
MKNIRTIIGLLMVMLPLVAEAQNDYEARLLKRFHAINSEEMAEWMEIICSDEMNGRLAGTPEYMMSAQFVASKLEEWGVAPAGDNGTYFQMFDHPYTVVNDIGALSLTIPVKNGPAIQKHYTAPKDYYPGMNSGNGTITAEVVFVGYGVTAPEHNYDDYKGIDVKGKIVLVNRDVPYKDTRNPEYARWVAYCYHHYKVENAAKHGAAGFLYIDGNSSNPNIAYVPSLIVAGIGAEPLSDIFAGTGKSNTELMAGIDKSYKPASFNTGKVMTITANTTRFADGKTANVVGMLKGTDPLLKEEVIVIGGHLDAVGNAGGLLVHGGLDNASGVVDIMAAAKAMALSGITLKRSVIFLFIGAEEVGLLGAKHYTQSPVFPKEKTVTYINLDMVGNGTGLSVSAGFTSSALLKYFTGANSSYIHRPMRANAATAMVTSYGRPRSDGVVFSSAGFRTMSVGTTDGVKPVFYHLPGDDASAVTIDIMEDVAKMLYVALTEMANDTGLKYQ